MYYTEIITADVSTNPFEQQNNCVKNFADLLVSAGFTKEREFVWNTIETGEGVFSDQICIDLKWKECLYSFRVRTMGDDGMMAGIIDSEAADTDIGQYWIGENLIDMKVQVIYNSQGCYFRFDNIDGTEGVCFTEDSAGNYVSWCQGSPNIDGVADYTQTSIDFPGGYSAKAGDNYFLCPVHIKVGGVVVSVLKNIYNFADSSISSLILQDSAGYYLGSIGQSWFRG